MSTKRKIVYIFLLFLCTLVMYYGFHFNILVWSIFLFFVITVLFPDKKNIDVKLVNESVAYNLGDKFPAVLSKLSVEHNDIVIIKLDDIPHKNNLEAMAYSLQKFFNAYYESTKKRIHCFVITPEDKVAYMSKYTTELMLGQTTKSIQKFGESLKRFDLKAQRVIKEAKFYNGGKIGDNI